YNSKKRVIANLGIPKEMFYMLGIDVLYVEQLSVLTATSTISQNREIIGKARTLVPSSTYCTFHQACLGVIESGYFPLPDVFVAPSFICEETVTLNTYLAKKYNKPVFYVDCPHSTDADAEMYLAEELHRLTLDLADYFKIKLDKERIRKTMHYTNEARKWWLKFLDLRSTINSRKFFTINIHTI
ncbi:MAG: 2-hydroxyacyl-CoA dehydratase, partial [bacterium]|nr:2-hydroxyacyl-CoA dehydratase [bacterium]